jgi:glycosyltransferase involved in cell wall biosynthesis
VIVFLSGEYPPDIGGVGDYTYHLRAALTNLGWQTRVVSRRDVRRWDARSLVWLLRHAPPKGVVHIQFQAAAFDLLGDICLLPWLVRRFRPGVRTATTFHDTHVPYLFPRAGALRRSAVRLLARTSHAVLAADRRDLAALGGPSPRQHYVPIAPNVACSPPAGYDRQAFRAELGLAEADLAVVYFGLLNASKGLDLLLDTFSRVLSGSPGARLLVLGGLTGASDPTDRATAAAIKPRLKRLGESVIQPGWQPQTRLSAYLLAGDVALLPYADGASGRRGSLLACAAHGLPIVSTQPAASEVAPYIRSVTADSNAMTDAVLEVHAQPNELHAASLALAEQMSWPRIAARHVDIYNRLLYSDP